MDYSLSALGRTSGLPLSRLHVHKAEMAVLHLENDDELLDSLRATTRFSLPLRCGIVTRWWAGARARCERRRAGQGAWTAVRTPWGDPTSRAHGRRTTTSACRSSGRRSSAPSCFSPRRNGTTGRRSRSNRPQRRRRAAAPIPAAASDRPITGERRPRRAILQTSFVTEPARRPDSRGDARSPEARRAARYGQLRRPVRSTRSPTSPTSIAASHEAWSGRCCRGRTATGSTSFRRRATWRSATR